jgi:uncharacterized protein (DUF1800 family)
MGLDRAVKSLTRPSPEVLRGPEPHANGQPLLPLTDIGHAHSWWLDRMVRTNRPLVERMTLVWHDWFATTNKDVQAPALMVRQNELFRAHALGSFANLFAAVTTDPAMLIFLNGNVNKAGAPNENFAREMMELFSLGVNRGYTESDIREQARALTGWKNDWVQGHPNNFWYDPALHDGGEKVVFGKRGTFDWQAACRLCIRHPMHSSFLVRKLWSYFIPVPPSRKTQRALERLYVRKRYAVRPVVEAILRHPAFYEGPAMVKPPVIYMAGLLRAKGRGIDTIDWRESGAQAGQELFKPPNVAGWNDDRWLDSGTWLARWKGAAEAIRPFAVTPQNVRPANARQLVDRALAFWNHPRLLRGTKKVLIQFAAAALADAGGDPATRATYTALAENTLRQLIATSPEFQVA